MAYVEDFGRDEDAIAAFSAYYLGSWRDIGAWAESVVEEQGWWEQLTEHADHRLLPHLRIDYERLGREQAYDAYIVDDTERSQVHVFRLHV